MMEKLKWRRIDKENPLRFMVASRGGGVCVLNKLYKSCHLQSIVLVVAGAAFHVELAYSCTKLHSGDHMVLTRT